MANYIDSATYRAILQDDSAVALSLAQEEQAEGVRASHNAWQSGWLFRLEFYQSPERKRRVQSNPSLTLRALTPIQGETRTQKYG
jgi:hypothetical protein